jgi:putative membrane protein
MVKKEPSEQTEKRILVLCVDRDGDLGTKAEIKTPVIGREENLQAAVKLALSDPEEPDANAIFNAVKTYDRLKSEGKPEETFEIATVSGAERGGVSADRKIVAELGELTDSFHATEVILVVDGYSDETVLPLVQSRVPVSAVSRIVVRHSESIEESAALFFRYFKMIWEDPRYSRPVLGIPGLLLLIALVLSIFNWLSIFWLVLIVFLSAIMIGKGFGADKRAKDFYRWVKEYSPPPLRIQISSFSAVIGALCIVVGVYLGWTNAALFVANSVTPPDLAGWVGVLPRIAGYFIKDAITLIVVGVCVALLGRAIRWYLEHDARLLRNAVLIVSVMWSRQIFDATSDLLKDPSRSYDPLMFWVFLGIMIAIASILVVFVIHRAYRGFFEETEEQVEEFGKD